MIRGVLAWTVGFLLLSGGGVAVAQDAKPVTRISQDLADLAAPPAAAARMQAEPGVPPEWRSSVTGDWVTIDAVASGDPAALEAELIALGASDTAIAGRMVSARFPIASIPSLEGVASLQFARPRSRMTTSAA